MGPDQQQIQNSLNPTPVSFNVPTAGLFVGGDRQSKDFGTIYKMAPDGSYAQAFDATSILTPQEKSSLNYGQQVDLAKNKIQQIYGFDISSLPSQNLADLNSTAYLQPLARRLGRDFNNGFDIRGSSGTSFGDFVQATPIAGFTSVNANTTPNQLASPGQMSAAVASGMQATPIQNQAPIKPVSAPSTSLQPGMTGDAVKQLQDFLVSKGFMTQDQVNTGYGIYGPQTTAAVKALQQSLGVDNSSGAGYFGPKTIAALSGNTTGSINQAGVGGSGAISTTGLTGSASPINLATSSGPSGNADALVAGAQQFTTSYDKQVSDATNAVNSEQGQYDTLSKQIGDLINGTQGKAGLQASADQQFGVAEKKAALDQINAQIQQKIAAYNALQTSIANKPITLDSVIGSIAATKAAAASEIGMLTATANALNGQYTEAVDAANRAVDLKYEDQMTTLNLKMQQLSLIKDELTAKQKIQADALNKKYQAQQDALNLSIQNQKEKNSTLLDLVSKYPDAGISLSTDSIETANRKIVSNSKIYQNSIKNVNSGSGLLSVSEAQALGVPYGTTQAQAQGITPTKPATAVQETTALYANRLEQSNKIISDLDKYVAGANPLTYAAQQKLPGFLNVLKSGDFQSVEQAQRNFVNAVLRRESGAVISPAEFDSAKQQYFAQPGDSQQVIDQKKANRDLVVQGFITGAGSAYTPLTSTGVLRSPDGTQEVNVSDLTPAQIQEAKDNGWK